MLHLKSLKYKAKIRTPTAVLTYSAIVSGINSNPVARRDVINNKNKFALTILFSLMCYGVTEAVMARAEIPVTILFISLMFINTNKKTELT